MDLPVDYQGLRDDDYKYVDQKQQCVKKDAEVCQERFEFPQKRHRTDVEIL